MIKIVICMNNTFNSAKTEFMRRCNLYTSLIKLEVQRFKCFTEKEALYGPDVNPDY